MEPGRKIDFQTCDSRVCFHSSPGLGGFGGRFNATCVSSRSTARGSHWHGHALFFVAAWSLPLRRRLALADPRVPEGAGRTAVDADATAHALVVVDDEQGVRRLGEGRDLLALAVLHD